MRVLRTIVNSKFKYMKKWKKNKKKKNKSIISSLINNLINNITKNKNIKIFIECNCFKEKKKNEKKS